MSIVPRPIKVSTDGFVDMPAADVDEDATYTFEARVEGRWYRWTGVRPTVIGDRARFSLNAGTPI